MQPLIPHRILDAISYFNTHTQFGIHFTRERRVVCHPFAAPSHVDLESFEHGLAGGLDVEVRIEGQWEGHQAGLNIKFCPISRKGGVAVCSQPLYNGDWMEEQVALTCFHTMTYDLSHVKGAWNPSHVDRVAYSVCR
jgi:hypothetical protein